MSFDGRLPCREAQNTHGPKSSDRPMDKIERRRIIGEDDDLACSSPKVFVVGSSARQRQFAIVLSHGMRFGVGGEGRRSTK